MNSKEISNYIFELCGNDNYISLDKHPDLVDTLVNHPDYSHISQRSVYSINLYFYCDGAPNGVMCIASIDSSKKDYILGKIDAITKALHESN